MLSETIAKVDGIISRVNTHPEYSDYVVRERFHALVEEAGKQSLDLELSGDGDPRYVGRDHSKSLKDLTDAEEILAREGISVYNLSLLGHIIEPENHPYGGFRKIEVNFPSPKDTIMNQTDSLVSFLEFTKAHPIMRAINAHIEIVKIHPYEDGNSRAARLVQNFCLRERGYPPAIVPLDERELYRELRKSVLLDRYNHRSSFETPSESETRFDEYMTSKVLSSAETLEEGLRSKRIYDVSLTGLKRPGVLRTVAQHIRSQGRKNDNGGVKVSIRGNSCKKERILRVVGDISSKDIELILKKSAERDRFNYEVDLNPKDCH